jgi:hypothetical protein
LEVEKGASTSVFRKDSTRVILPPDIDDEGVTVEFFFSVL